MTYPHTLGKAAAVSIFGQLGAGGLGSVKLKKTDTVLKTMFRAGEGQQLSTSKDGGTNAAVPVSKDPRKSLSKLIEFPGDLEEIKRHIQNSAEINPAGLDAYGLNHSQ